MNPPFVVVPWIHHLLWSNSSIICCGPIDPPFVVVTWIHHLLWSHESTICCDPVDPLFVVVPCIHHLLWSHESTICCGPMDTSFIVVPRNQQDIMVRLTGRRLRDQHLLWLIRSGCSSKLRGTHWFESRPGRIFVIEVVSTVLQTVQRQRRKAIFTHSAYTFLNCIRETHTIVNPFVSCIFTRRHSKQSIYQQIQDVNGGLHQVNSGWLTLFFQSIYRQQVPHGQWHMRILWHPQR